MVVIETDQSRTKVCLGEQSKMAALIETDRPRTKALNWLRQRKPYQKDLRFYGADHLKRRTIGKLTSHSLPAVSPMKKPGNKARVAAASSPIKSSGNIARVGAASRIDELCKDFPDASRPDCERFFAAFGKKHAAHHLGNYLVWKNEYCSCVNDSLDTRGDISCWDFAVQRALKDIGKGGIEENSVSTCEDSDTNNENQLQSEVPIESEFKVPDAKKEGGTKKLMLLHRGRNNRKTACQMEILMKEGNQLSLPPFVFLHKNKETGDYIRDLKGNRILHALPAQIDLRFSKEVYTNTIALYLEQIFRGASSKEQATLVLDVRPGRGWPNAQANHMVSFIRHVANQLHLLHPNRLHKCILYPIPRPAIAFWKSFIQPFLDPKLRKIIVLVPGSGANLLSPPPNEKLGEFLSEKDLEYLEQHRLSCFRKVQMIPASKEKIEELDTTRQSCTCTS